MQRSAAQEFFVRQKRRRRREKKSVTQELAAASDSPPAFHKQLESCCVFRIRASAGGMRAEFRCGALRCVTLWNVMTETTR